MGPLSVDGRGSSEENKIIQSFFDFIQGCTGLIQYNGSRFDQPFLEARAGQYNVESPLSGLRSLDLYKELKVCRPLLGLSGMKQSDLEIFLRQAPRRFCDGGKCIQIYRAYLHSKGSDLAEIVLGHNREDLIGLGNITSMLGYRAFYKGIYTLFTASEKRRNLFRPSVASDASSRAGICENRFLFTGSFGKRSQSYRSCHKRKNENSITRIIRITTTSPQRTPPYPGRSASTWTKD